MRLPDRAEPGRWASSANELTWKSLKVPLLLLALSVVPVLGGIARLATLTAPSTAESARFVASPAPFVLHIASSVFFCVLGAFQFSPAIRLRWPGWHRGAGRLLVACGLASGLTGLWMTARYRIPVDLQGPLLHTVRMAVGAAMIGAILASVWSILRRDVPRHEAWMIRGYALGQGVGTQAFVLGPWVLAFGAVDGLPRDLLMTLAWAINAGVAELVIRRRALAARPRPSGLSLAPRP
jgi:hypothetical protein